MASEYGWSKRDIFYDVYFDELFFLTKQIEKRTIAEYKMQLAIAQNPHVKNPKELWKVLEGRSDVPVVSRPEEFDPAGFNLFKNTLRQSPKFIVK